MTDTLVLNYREGGSRQLVLRDPIEDSVSRSTLQSARALLVGRRETDALALLDARAFELCAATNGFGDAFLAVIARVSPERFAEYQEEMEHSRASLSRAGAAIRDAVASANKDDREIRFVALCLAENIVRGVHGEYRFDEESFDSGAFARIHRARTATGELVAFKRLYVRDEEAVARLRREIQEQLRIAHPGVMPVLDHDPRFGWFIMPLATENLVDAWQDRRLDEALLLTVLRQAMAGLDAAHRLGLVHRDVSPRNVLRVGDAWVVADWGVVRRPRGMTTLVRTQGELGTLGFAAPELFRDGHAAEASADVYALGRIAAWAITREWPEQNVALAPAHPWDLFVGPATVHDPVRRPQSMAHLAHLLDKVERVLRPSTDPRRPVAAAPLPNPEYEQAAAEVLVLFPTLLDEPDVRELVAQEFPELAANPAHRRATVGPPPRYPSRFLPDAVPTPPETIEDGRDQLRNALTRACDGRVARESASLARHLATDENLSPDAETASLQRAAELARERFRMQTLFARTCRKCGRAISVFTGRCAHCA